MSLTVLTDDQVSGLLEELSRDEVQGLANTLTDALHGYSKAQQTPKDNGVHQPERTVVNSEETGATSLFMPSLSPQGLGVKVVTLSGPSADPAKPRIKPTGSVTVYSPEGNPVGFLHAKALTAFRTALASTCLLAKRDTVETLTVFGAGLQAYWHIRLALKLRGDSIRTVNIMNRDFSANVKEIYRKFVFTDSNIKSREGWGHVNFFAHTRKSPKYGRLQSQSLLDADVVYCCTPSTEPLFSADKLLSFEGRRKGRLFVAVGSYKPEMHELPQGLIHQALKYQELRRGIFFKHAVEGGMIIVDTIDGSLKEAGELIQANVSQKRLVELGEIAMVRKSYKEGEEEVAGQKAEEKAKGKAKQETAKEATTSTQKSTPRVSFSLPTSPTTISATSDNESSSDSSRSGGIFGGMLTRQRSFSMSSIRKKLERQLQAEEHLETWLREGNVIYKSVGLGLMDLTVGLEVVKMAEKKGAGTEIPNFSNTSY